MEGCKRVAELEEIGEISERGMVSSQDHDEIAQRLYAAQEAQYLGPPASSHLGAKFPHGTVAMRSNIVYRHALHIHSCADAVGRCVYINSLDKAYHGNKENS